MDTFSPEMRSEVMRRVKGANTGPELAVRRLCRELGLTGYRIHKKTLPGKPDIAWIGKKVAIFVNGCFWHGHRCSKNRQQPENNKEFWRNKLQRNRKRDASNIRALRAMGWKVCVIWECELKEAAVVKNKILNAVWPASNEAKHLKVE